MRAKSYFDNEVDKALLTRLESRSNEIICGVLLDGVLALLKSNKDFLKTLYREYILATYNELIKDNYDGFTQQDFERSAVRAFEACRKDHIESNNNLKIKFGENFKKSYDEEYIERKIQRFSVTTFVAQKYYDIVENILGQKIYHAQSLDDWMDTTAS